MPLAFAKSRKNSAAHVSLSIFNLSKNTHTDEPYAADKMRIRTPSFKSVTMS